MGHELEMAGKEVLGFASKVVITKDSTLIVTDGSNRQAVEERVTMIKGQIEVQLFQSYLEFVCYIYHVCIITGSCKVLLNSQNSKERYNKKILGERIARLCGAIAIIQVPHIVSVYEVKHLRCRKKIN